jgi:UDP-N-acetylmuramoyl-tripeptide--D-alanyl-D-alanine ligase
LAAAPAALAVGEPVEAVAERLSGATLSRWRMELHEGPDGILVVNDAYNANPQSMEAALDTLSVLAAGGRRPVAVLGEMAEIGPIAAEEHFRIGRLAGSIEGLAGVVVVGPGAAGIGDGAAEVGATVVRVGSVEEALTALGGIIRAGDAVLVKASRVVGLERVAAGLLAGVTA